jgi:hypothetical protein
MADKKFFVDIDLQANNAKNLKADTLDINTNLASENAKRIVFHNNTYYYSNGTIWISMSGGGSAQNGIPSGGAEGQILAKNTATDYDAIWIDNNGGTVNQKRHDYSAPYDYNAYAPQGTLDTDTTWNVTRLTINADGTFTKGVATGAWSNRTNLTYN